MSQQTTNPKPVTISDEELEAYQARSYGFDGLGPDEVERLIAALREARAEAKLAKMRKALTAKTAHPQETEPPSP